MTWTPLVRAFCAESTQNGISFSHTYHAPDWQTAEKIANARGWTFLGELQETIEISDAEVEMFRRDVEGWTIQ